MASLRLDLLFAASRHGHGVGLSATAVFGALAMAGVALQLRPIKESRVANVLAAACWVAAGELLLLPFVRADSRLLVGTFAAGIVGPLVLYAITRAAVSRHELARKLRAGIRLKHRLCEGAPVKRFARFERKVWRWRDATYGLLLKHERAEQFADEFVDENDSFIPRTENAAFVVGDELPDTDVVAYLERRIEALKRVMGRL